MVLAVAMRHKSFLSVSLALAGLCLASTFAALAAGAGIGPSFKGPIGLQLYSLRDQFKTDVPGTLDKVRSFGFRYAELAGTYGQTPEQFKGALESRGIKPIAGHFGYDRFRTDIEGIREGSQSAGPEIRRLRLDPPRGTFR